MPRRPVANQNCPEPDYLTVSQIAAAMGCDRGMIYDLIEKGQLLGVRPFHESGVLRVPVQSYQEYKARLAEAAEQRLAIGAPAAPSSAPRPRPRVKVDHAEHRAAKERMRARGIVR